MKFALLGVALVIGVGMMPADSSAQVAIGVTVRLAPPPLPVYAQPPLPGPDYLWTPGYWAWDDYAAAYYWVPGTWVHAPRPGLLWTPPWWGWNDGAYVFHTGYWGSHIGFYGGVAYGFGYTGFGYQGGYWNGGHLFYNQTVNNITNVHVTNVYQSNVTNVTNTRINRVSYNGGPGGVHAQPRPEEQSAGREQHIAPTARQQDHVQAARGDPQAFASANHGRPLVAATPRVLGNGGGGPATGRQGFASTRGSGEPGDPRRAGFASARVPSEPGGPNRDGFASDGGAASRLTQQRVTRAERSAGEPRGGGDPHIATPGAAASERYAGGGRDVDARTFDRPPPVNRASHDSDPFAPPHGPSSHTPRPPHAPKPPRPPKPQHRPATQHHDDHHHG